MIRSAARPRLSAAERRRRILDAATEVFAEQGYVAASVGEIAARAGVVASVIYDHFGSKRELHIELLERHGEELIERSIRQVAADEPRELVRASVEAFYRFVEEDPFVWRFLFRDPPADPEIATVHRRVRDRATAGIADLVAATAPGVGTVFDTSAERAGWMVARTAQAATNGLAEWWWENSDVPREQVVELLLAVLWNGLGELVERAAPPAGGPPTRPPAGSPPSRRRGRPAR